jgi:dipeptidyl aminopeptidase/acylaminoacyl peptidase
VTVCYVSITRQNLLKVPLLIMHGGADKGVDPDQSLTLAQKLQKHRTTYELIIYAEDGHVLRNNQQDRDRRAVAWFRRFLKR